MPGEQMVKANGIELCYETFGEPGMFDEERVREYAGLAYDRCFNPAGTARQLLAIVASGSRADGLTGLDVPTLPHLPQIIDAITALGASSAASPA